MTSHDAERPTATAGRRPLSLLLQALKQIESKSPSEPAIVSSAFVAASPFIAETTAPPCELSIDVVRQYREGETNSEVALAEPCELPAVPPDNLAPSSESETPPAKSQTEDLTVGRHVSSSRMASFQSARGIGVPPVARGGPRYDAWRLGQDVLGLLPDDARAVIAIVSFEEANAGSVAHEICGGLAGLNVGTVLEIGDEGAARPAEGSGITFVDVVSGRGRWQDAVTRRTHSSLSSLPRGNPQALNASSRRRLLTVWQELGEQFEYVVIDVTAFDLDQAPLILSTCDAAFIALRLNETKRADVERLAARIRTSGCHLCGCLVPGP